MHEHEVSMPAHRAGHPGFKEIFIFILGNLSNLAGTRTGKGSVFLIHK